jgi:hypothetical protein
MCGEKSHAFKEEANTFSRKEITYFFLISLHQSCFPAGNPVTSLSTLEYQSAVSSQRVSGNWTITAEKKTCSENERNECTKHHITSVSGTSQ